jgi:hypothetical protein
MQVTGVREFRSRATQLLAGDEVVFVTRHGKLTSILVPMTKPESLPIELRQELVERLGNAISAHLRRRGVTERQILADFKAWRAKRRANRRRR